MSENTFKQLADTMRLGSSERIVKIWSLLCNEEEASILLAMPGPVESIALKTGMGVGAVEESLSRLFMRGVAFEENGADGIVWSRPKGLIHFHDSTVIWKEAPETLKVLWKEFMDEEYPMFVSMVKKAGLGPFMRVVPVNKKIESGTEILPYEDAAEIVKKAKKIAVVECRCRMTRGKCDANREVCLQLNEFAEYMVKRGSGRIITNDEAIAILDDAERAGLIHAAENRSSGTRVLCNCCTCCCLMLGPMIKYGAFANPSRYVAVVSESECSGCGMCESRCRTQAIKVEADFAVVDDKKCIGCGLCSTACPTEAISLKEIRSKQFIP
ncbi:MAG TPA: 4Fe-4S binding protein [bacterium]|nr:4Fe-4S binding protein [bacterium]